MGRSSYKIKGYTPEQIKGLFDTKHNYKIRLRLCAVYQVSLGKPSRELAALYNTSFKQILNWVHRFEESGLDGLRDKRGRGRKSNLSTEQKQALKTLILEESPLKYGYNTETWTGPMLIDWIKKEYDVSYKRAQIYNIIKSLGFTYRKAKGFYPEADPVAKKEFRERLKKNS